MWQETGSNAKLSCSTLVSAHSWPKQTYKSTLKQWKSIILVWHTNKLPWRVARAVDFPISPRLWECSHVSPVQGKGQSANYQHLLKPVLNFSDWPFLCTGLMWQETGSNAKLSCSTLAIAHSWPKQTYKSTLKQWKSIILVWHTSKLPWRVARAVDFPILPRLWECSHVTRDWFQRQIVM